MSVGNGGHSIDLEILVWSDLRHGFDWSPVSERWLSIIEPFVAKLLDMVVVDMSNSLGNLTSWESSAELEDVLTDIGINRLWGLGGQELVVEVVSASDALNIIEIMRVDGWETHTAIVHLSSEDFVSEEVVTEKTGVRVSEVVRVSSGDINEVSEKSVHRVVLLVHIIQMFSMLIDSVRSEHVLQEKEGVVVLVLDSWGIVEDTNVRVDHLVISDEEKGWDVNSLITVLSSNSGGLWKGRESLLDSLDNLVVGNITSGNNDDVISEVVGSVVVSQVINTQLGGQISISFNWLSEHVLSEWVEMSIFKSGLNISVVIIFVLHWNFILDEFELSRVEGVVAEHITENVDGSWSISLKDLEVVASEFSIGVSWVSSTHVLNGFSQLSLGLVSGTSEGHLLEEIWSSTSGKIFVSWSSTNVDTDTIWREISYMIYRRFQIITYLAVAPGIFSEQTLIPFERVVESIIIIINKKKLILGTWRVYQGS
jgi:hypothetical protein